jgi:ribosomal protein L29
MAIVRKRDLKALNASELKKKLEEMELEIVSERASAKSSGRPANSGRLHEAKKLRARILTFLSQKETKSLGK